MGVIRSFTVFQILCTGTYVRKVTGEGVDLKKSLKKVVFCSLARFEALILFLYIKKVFFLDNDYLTCTKIGVVLIFAQLWISASHFELRPCKRVHDFENWRRDFHCLPAGILLMQKLQEDNGRKKKKLSIILFG